MIGAREANDAAPACIEACEAHRRHDGLGAAHVEGDLVQTRDGLEQAYVLLDHGVHRSEDRPELLDLLPTLLDPRLVAVEPGDVQAVRTADIQGPITVQVLKPWTSGCGHRRADAEPFAHQVHERERYACGIRESKVRQTPSDLVPPADGLLVSRIENGAQSREAVPSPSHLVLPGAVGSEEVRRSV